MSDAILTAPAAAIRAAQERNFAATLDLVFERHDYYRALFAERGISRADIRLLGDLPKLPVTGKNTYLSEHRRFVLDSEGLPLEARMVWEVLYTTGSTGAPTPFVSTSHDFYNILTSYRRMLTMRGVGRDDVLANLYPLTQYPQGAYIRVMNAASALHIPVVAMLPGRPSPDFKHGSGQDEVVEALERFGATAAWGVPSYVRQVLRRAAELGRRLPRLRHLLLSGEGLGEAARAEILERAREAGADGAEIKCSYAATELQGGFVECCTGSGFHNAAPEEFFVEIVDPETHEPVPEGREGLVLVTHLNRRGTVLLRYALGDIAALDRTPCPHCGATVERLSQPRRADDLVKIKGMLVNPSVLHACLAGHPEVEEYQFRVTKSDPADAFSMDRLELAYAARHGADGALEARLAAAVKEAAGVTPVLRAVPAMELVDPGRHWKAKRFADLRPKP